MPDGAAAGLRPPVLELRPGSGRVIEIPQPTILRAELVGPPPPLRQAVRLRDFIPAVVADVSAIDCAPFLRNAIEAALDLTPWGGAVDLGVGLYRIAQEIDLPVPKEKTLGLYGSASSALLCDVWGGDRVLLRLAPPVIPRNGYATFGFWPERRGGLHLHDLNIRGVWDVEGFMMRTLACFLEMRAVSDFTVTGRCIWGHYGRNTALRASGIYNSRSYAHWVIWGAGWHLRERSSAPGHPIAVDALAQTTLSVTEGSTALSAGAPVFTAQHVGAALWADADTSQNYGQRLVLAAINSPTSATLAAPAKFTSTNRPGCWGLLRWSVAAPHGPVVPARPLSAAELADLIDRPVYVSWAGQGGAHHRAWVQRSSTATAIVLHPPPPRTAADCELIVPAIDLFTERFGQGVFSMSNDWHVADLLCEQNMAPVVVEGAGTGSFGRLKTHPMNNEALAAAARTYRFGCGHLWVSASFGFHIRELLMEGLCPARAQMCVAAPAGHNSVGWLGYQGTPGARLLDARSGVGQPSVVFGPADQWIPQITAAELRDSLVSDGTVRIVRTAPFSTVGGETLPAPVGEVAEGRANGTNIDLIGRPGDGAAGLNFVGADRVSTTWAVFGSPGGFQMWDATAHRYTFGAGGFQPGAAGQLINLGSPARPWAGLHLQPPAWDGSGTFTPRLLALRSDDGRAQPVAIGPNLHLDPATGVLSGTGGGGGGGSFLHTQATASAEWLVNHNLGFQPDVAVRNAGGVEVEAEVAHVSANTTRIRFNSPAAGTARFT